MSAGRALAKAPVRLLLSGASALVLLTGCGTGGGAGEGAGDGSGDLPSIVVTTNILGDVTENLVGDAAEVTTFMKPNADPHSFEISPQEAVALSEADLVVSNGLGLEEGLVQHLERAESSGARMFVAGDHVEVLRYSVDGEDPAADAAPDSHFWTDPAQMIAVVDALGTELSGIEGIDASAVEEHAASYRAELEAVDEEMGTAFAAIPTENRKLVTNHHVFGYLAHRFDFEVVGAVIPGGTTLAAPSAADLRDLTDAIETAGVRTIFAESSQPDRLVQVLASEAGIEVEVVELFTESLTEPGAGAETYLQMMRVNTERISEGLGR